jgi:hypothetical protein
MAFQHQHFPQQAALVPAANPMGRFHQGYPRYTNRLRDAAA